MRISDWSSDVCSSDLLELGDIGGDEIVDALDLAVADRGAKQRRGHRLGDREGNPFVFGFLAEAIFLEHDLAMTDYEKTRDALARNILVDRDGASIVVQRRGNLLVGARQRANLGTALDDAHREIAADVEIGRD